MAFSICNLRPLLVFSLQRRRIPSQVRIVRPHVNQDKSHLQFFSSYKTCHSNFRTKSASVNGYPVSNDDDNPSPGYAIVALRDKVKRWFKFVREIFPGGEWWRLSSEEIDVALSAKPVTVLLALQKMWEMVAQDRWVIYTAFVSLIATAVCEIQF
ncbi:ABC transporter B family member 26, chloroplastic-like [Dorcoceras hygrometricum]|nr:ABC transporter B family member 26, chloroplastic-like [Dorcoceras hygrometricum]